MACSFVVLAMRSSTMSLSTPTAVSSLMRTSLCLSDLSLLKLSAGSNA